jgi:hypothetical protein
VTRFPFPGMATGGNFPNFDHVNLVDGCPCYALFSISII